MLGRERRISSKMGLGLNLDYATHSCVASGGLLHLSELSILTRKMGMIVFLSQAAGRIKGEHTDSS